MRLLNTRISLLMGAVLATALPLPAAISYSGIQNIAIPAESFSGVFLDFNPAQASVFTTSTSAPATWDFNFFFGGAAIATSNTLQPVTASATTNSRIVEQTALVDTIDNTDTFPSSFSGSTDHMDSQPSGTFTSPGSANEYLGFRLDAGGGDYYYGWMRVSLSEDGDPNDGVIHDWAWELTANSGILVGVIPEPSLPGLTALILFSCVLFRRQRRELTVS